MMPRVVAQSPYRVSLYQSWADHDGIHVGFQTEEEARAFAASRPEPLIDLTERDGNGPYRRHGGLVIATRRMLPWRYDEPLCGHDDFPQRVCPSGTPLDGTIRVHHCDSPHD